MLFSLNLAETITTLDLGEKNINFIMLDKRMLRTNESRFDLAVVLNMCNTEKFCSYADGFCTTTKVMYQKRAQNTKQQSRLT